MFRRLGLPKQPTNKRTRSTSGTDKMSRVLAGISSQDEAELSHVGGDYCGRERTKGRRRALIIFNLLCLLSSCPWSLGLTLCTSLLKLFPSFTSCCPLLRTRSQPRYSSFSRDSLSSLDTRFISHHTAKQSHL